MNPIRDALNEPAAALRWVDVHHSRQKWTDRHQVSSDANNRRSEFQIHNEDTLGDRIAC